MIRLLIASEIRFYREGLAGLLPAAGTIAVVGTAADWACAVEASRAHQPTAILVDATLLPDKERLRELKAAAPGMKVLVVALPSAAEEAVGWIESGADGYVPREASLKELRIAVEASVRGEVCCSPDVTARLFRRVARLSQLLSERTTGRPRQTLTPREREVAGLIAEGLSNKGISRKLGIEIATTKNHVHNILSKLSLDRRTQVAAWHHRVKSQPLASHPHPGSDGRA